MATATITITLPTARTDGSALAPGDIASISVFDSASPGTAIGVVDTPSSITLFATKTLAVGDHNFTATVTDTTGHVSAPSNIASVTVPATLANPNPPIITATLNP
jgi:hypothetical protein